MGWAIIVSLTRCRRSRSPSLKIMGPSISESLVPSKDQHIPLHVPREVDLHLATGHTRVGIWNEAFQIAIDEYPMPDRLQAKSRFRKPVRGIAGKIGDAGSAGMVVALGQWRVGHGRLNRRHGNMIATIVATVMAIAVATVMAVAVATVMAVAVAVAVARLMAVGLVGRVTTHGHVLHRQ